MPKKAAPKKKVVQGHTFNIHDVADWSRYIKHVDQCDHNITLNLFTEDGQADDGLTVKLYMQHDMRVFDDGMLRMPSVKYQLWVETAISDDCILECPFGASTEDTDVVDSVLRAAFDFLNDAYEKEKEEADDMMKKLPDSVHDIYSEAIAKFNQQAAKK